MTRQNSPERRSKKPVSGQQGSSKRKHGSGGSEPIVFRDERGRFAKMDAMVIIDETGNPGKAHVSGEHFSMTAVITYDPHGFGEISRKHKAEQMRSGRLGPFTRRDVMRTGELKAKSDTAEGIDRVIDEIAASGAEVHVLDIDKGDPPEWWTSGRNGSVAKSNGNAALDRTLDGVLPEVRGKRMGVVVDRSNNYTSVKRRISKRSGKDMVAEGDGYDSAKGPYKNQLQTNDYVPYAINLMNRGKDKKPAEKLKVKRLKNRGRLRGG